MLILATSLFKHKVVVDIQESSVLVDLLVSAYWPSVCGSISYVRMTPANNRLTPRFYKGPHLVLYKKHMVKRRAPTINYFITPRQTLKPEMQITAVLSVHS